MLLRPGLNPGDAGQGVGLAAVVSEEDLEELLERPAGSAGWPSPVEPEVR